VGTARLKHVRIAVALSCVVFLAGCGLANPWPSIPGGATGHHEILLIGDSILGESGTYLPAALANAGIDAHVTDAHVNSMGLLDPVPGDGRSVTDYFEAAIAAHPADIVVFEFIGDCSCARSAFYGSDNFYTQWFNVAADLAQRAKAHGAQPLWIASPPVRSDPANNVAAVVHGLAFRDSLMPARSGTGFADWWAAFTDTGGNYQQALFYDGAPHTVRFDDSIHFTDDGAARAARFTVAGIRALL
jgi:hypothetical protein